MLKVELVVLPLGIIDMIIGMDILSAVGAVISCNPPRLKLDNRQLAHGRTVEEVSSFIGSLSVDKEDFDQVESWSRQETEIPECVDIAPLWDESDVLEDTFEIAIEKTESGLLIMW